VIGVYDLSTRRLYLCTPLRDDILEFVNAALTGGVDVLQLRDKDADDDTIVRHGRDLVTLCHDHGVPFIMNDRPDLAVTIGADGVHVGQDDETVARCRELLGPDALVGLSTHSDDDLTRALDQPTSYVSAGPIMETPTKSGRPATGAGYAQRAVASTSQPVFVTGGVNADRVPILVRAGLTRFVVVRALTEVADVERSARHICEAIDEALAAL
jgi:thiamine-phosphate pyrophosphorylase